MVGRNNSTRLHDLARARTVVERRYVDLCDGFLADFALARGERRTQRFVESLQGIIPRPFAWRAKLVACPGPALGLGKLRNPHRKKRHEPPIKTRADANRHNDRFGGHEGAKLKFQINENYEREPAHRLSREEAQARAAEMESKITESKADAPS